MRVLFCSILWLSLFGLTGCWETYEEPPQKTIPLSAAASADWKADMSALLQAHVNEQGLVDYAALAEKKDKVEGILAAMANLDTTQMSEGEKLAFWFNAYNISMWWNILSAYPNVKEGLVTDYKDAFFDTNLFALAGQEVSLNMIENQVLRRDPVLPGVSVERLRPELHVALSCAAMSCPPIRNKLWVAETIEEDMKSQMTKVLNDERFLSLDPSGKPSVTTLVDWYNPDFKADGKTVGAYLASWLTDDKADLKKALEEAGDDKAKLIFKPYDWKLNHQ